MSAPGSLAPVAPLVTHLPKQATMPEKTGSPTRRMSGAGYADSNPSLMGCIKAATTFFALILQPHAAEAANSGKAKIKDRALVQKVVKTFMENGGTSVIFAENHFQPENPVVWLQISDGALAGHKGPVEQWHETILPAELQLKMEQHLIGRKVGDAVSEMLIYVVPTTEETPIDVIEDMAAMIANPRASFQILNWYDLTRNDADRYLASKGPNIARVGYAHAWCISEPPDHLSVKPVFLPVPFNEIPMAEAEGLSPEGREKIFNLLAQSQQVRTTMMIVMASTIQRMFSDESAGENAIAQFIEYYNGQGYVVVATPVIGGYFALHTVPEKFLDSMRALASKEPGIGIYWNESAKGNSSPSRSEL